MKIWAPAPLPENHNDSFPVYPPSSSSSIVDWMLNLRVITPGVFEQIPNKLKLKCYWYKSYKWEYE